MKQNFIPVEESFKQWKKDPKFVAAYDALEAEFSLASALIKARADADMTQEPGASRPGHGHNASRHRPLGKRQGPPLDAHPGTLRQSHKNPSAHQLRSLNKRVGISAPAPPAASSTFVVNCTPSAFITASVVFSVGFPFALNDL